MKPIARPRRILHVDLAPFLVAVERMRDPSLGHHPLVIGGSGDWGRVAAASDEARALGVEVGQPITLARRVCPEAQFRPGDLEAYARVSDEVTAILTVASPRVERPSADEAFVDLSATAGALRTAVAATEALRDAIQRRLGLDASFGLGGSRLSARIASRWARPRGLLLLLPQHETSFIRRQPITLLDPLPSRAACQLAQAGLTTIGDVLDAAPERLRTLLGSAAAAGLMKAVDAEHEPPISPAAPPAFIQEEQHLREPAPDAEALLRVLEALAARVARRLARYQAQALGICVGVRRGERFLERAVRLAVAARDAATLQALAARAIAPLLDPVQDVRAVRVRLAPLEGASSQYALFSRSGANARE
jgi:DNA polymerase-4